MATAWTQDAEAKQAMSMFGTTPPTAEDHGRKKTHRSEKTAQKKKRREATKEEADE